ncbi:MAG: GNAT family N-acetyltransferase [Anaerolineales bacterium]|nr:GNAT family N-acetyltransferase [Anaerolineales bacterium]
MTIHVAQKNDFLQIAELIEEQNRDPARQCIHSGAGWEAGDVLQIMLKWEEIGEIVFVIAQQGEGVVGVLGCEFDEGLGRGWLWGPFLGAGDWQAIAAALYHALLDALPASIQQLDSFLNILNQRGQDFYRQQGFVASTLAHVYSAERPEAPASPSQACPPLAPQYHPGFSNLHSTIFPAAYYSAERVIGQIDDRNQVFVYIDGGQVLGYVYASFSDDSQEGEVEFLGVREDARGRGIGRQLLQAALRWLFDEKGALRATLTVNQENANARALYESVGFRLMYTGIGAERKLD